MQRHYFVWFILLVSIVTSCNSSSQATPTAVATEIEIIRPTNTATSLPTLTASPSLTPTVEITLAVSETVSPTETITPVPIPTVASLKAKVTAERLSCRYGPGPQYLYLFALRATANIKLIGRVDAENWDWYLVENQVPCWVKGSFVEVQGDPKQLPVVYPGVAKLPITPYYPRSEVLSAERNPATNEVTISWLEIPISPGDFESDNMQTYIVELWRCENGQLIFDPLATRLAFIRFVEEPGCAQPSHGRVWVQEKHGYAGPADIPWPAP